MSAQLRFGIVVLQSFPVQEMLERWKTIELLGFDSLWVTDHFVDPYASNIWFDGWSMLSASAMATERIHIGTMVTSITLHNPALLAKRAMTVDHLSNGRLILGIGAGRAPLDHAMPGIPVWEPSERTRRYREFVEIVQHMLTHRITSYQGQYYQVEEAVMDPLPVQQPLPRLMLAAHGDLSLKLTARLASTWNSFLKFNATAEESFELAKQQNSKLDEYCTAIGRDPSTLSRSLLCGLTQNRLFASREAFRDAIGHFQEAGIDEFMFYWTSDLAHAVFPNLHETTISNRNTLEWVAEEVANRVRT